MTTKEQTRIQVLNEVLDGEVTAVKAAGLMGVSERHGRRLLAAKRDLELPRMLRKLDNFDLLVIDDLGYLPQGADESKVLFTLIAERYERRSLGITSNHDSLVTRGFRVGTGE